MMRYFHRSLESDAIVDFSLPFAEEVDPNVGQAKQRKREWILI
jgi:hypothetical protein